MIKKRIAFVANTSWYLYNLRLGVIRRLKNYGYEIVTIAPKDSYTHYLVSEGLEHHNIPVDNKGRNFFKDFLYFWRLTKLYRKIRPDFVFHYTIKPNIYGSIATKINRTPSISVVSGAGYTFIRKDFLYDFSILLYKIAMRFPYEIWFVNKDDLQEFVEKKIVHASKTKLLPGEGVNIQHFAPREDTRTNSEIIFLLSARLIWDKGVGEYVQAAKIIKEKYLNVQFHLLGFLDVENPNAISSEQIFKWHEERYIQYLGKTEDVRPYLQNADCFVLPSYYREGTPRSLLEAAAMEKPIITTDNIGCREVVEDGYNGFLCRKQDVASLVEKMEQMIRFSNQQRREMGWNGRRMVMEKFDEELVIDRYLQVLSSIFNESNATKQTN